MSWFKVCLHCFSPLRETNNQYICTEPTCGRIYDPGVYTSDCIRIYGDRGSKEGVREDVFRTGYANHMSRRSIIPHWQDWDNIGKNPYWIDITNINEDWRGRKKNQNIPLDVRAIPDRCNCGSKLCTWKGSAYCHHNLPDGSEV